MRTLRIIVYRLSLALTVLAMVVSPASGQTGVNVTTWHNDNGRTGQNTQENHFYTSGSLKLSKNNFGVLCNFPTQGQVYAEPLVIAHTNDNGMDVYVADMQDYLYKFRSPGVGPDCAQPSQPRLPLIFFRVIKVSFRYPAVILAASTARPSIPLLGS